MAIRSATYVVDPVPFVESNFGTRLWEKQEEIIEAVFSRPRVAVRSCHDVGKTFAAAHAALTFFLAHKPCVVVTTAPTWLQVERILWREIASAFRKIRKHAVGELFTTRLEASNRLLIGLSTDEPERFQGFHAENILFVVDEASGVREEVYEAIEGSLASGNAHLLLIGNPTRRSGSFFEAFRSPLFHKIHISAYDYLNWLESHEPIPGLLTQGWVEERKAAWGEDSPLFQIRVLGEFPSESEDMLIPFSWLTQACERELEPDGRPVLAVDPARYGQDETVCIEFRDPCLTNVVSWKGRNLMHLTGFIKDWWGKNRGAIGIDTTGGLGAGVADRLREQKIQPREINFAGKPSRDDVLNLRAEMYFLLRERLDPQSQAPISLRDVGFLLADLSSLRFEITSAGKLKIEEKDSFRSRTGRSCDWGDALAMAVWLAQQRRKESILPRFSDSELEQTSRWLRSYA